MFFRGKPHPDDQFEGNKIIRLYELDGRFSDLTVDQTIALKLNQWRDWLCAAGVFHLYINFDGILYRGNCRMGGKLGNVYEDFDLPTEWIRCGAEFCGCGSDVMTPKVRGPMHLQRLMNLNQENHRGPSVRIQAPEAPIGVETAFRPRPNEVRVQWDVGRRCNYSCSYCWPDVHSDSEPVRTFEQMQRAVDQLLAKMPKDRTVMFQFGGGEPTLVKDFHQLLAGLRDKGHRSVVTSNGIRHVSFWRELIKVASVNLSVHFEFANLDRLRDNIQGMIEEIHRDPTCGRLEIKMMCPPGSVEKAETLSYRLNEIPNFHTYAAWSFVPIRHGSDNLRLAARMVEYSPRELEILQAPRHRL